MFTPGQTNYIDELNRMLVAFNAGPYNALPLTGGTLAGRLTVASTLVPGIVETVQLVTNSGSGGISGCAIKFGYPNAGAGTRIVGGGDPTIEYGGYTAFETGIGPGNYREVVRINARGAMLIGSVEGAGEELLRVRGAARIAPPGEQGTYLMQAGIDGAQPSMALFAGNGDGFGQPASVMYAGRTSMTNRSITTLGTVNTMGNDYAEYMIKCLGCGSVAPGQIIGLTADNTITDLWADAVMFAVKSTAPSFVGGDSWAGCIGPRPTPQAGLVPTPPPRLMDMIEKRPLPGTSPTEYADAVVPGDSDAEWAQKLAAYTTALAAHSAAVQQDAEAMAAFDAALEIERQKVDRIAIAGRVPVNVLGAQPGDYIVPVQDGGGIKGISVRQADLSHLQYLQAVGRVISIEPDGRAYVMVKVV